MIMMIAVLVVVLVVVVVVVVVVMVVVALVQTEKVAYGGIDRSIDRSNRNLVGAGILLVTTE